jgi:hypothetical protein
MGLNKPETTPAPRAGWIHGPTVDKKTRELRYVSPSSLQQADMSTEKGCMRKWWYDKIEGKREPSTRQQEEGTADHAVVERYLLTGERVFSPRAAKGVHMLPPPGPRLRIEHDMVPILYDAEGKEISGLHLAPLRAAGIPVAGRIDLMHDLCLNYGADSPEHMQDPEGTWEVFDHKFTKDLRFAVNGPDLARTIQMAAYGEYVFLTTDAKLVRLSHGYYPHQGSARKSTVRVDRTPLSRFWVEHVEPLARSMSDAAKEPTADTVPANTKACRAFNKDCMHASYCSAGMQGSLASLVGQTAAQSLVAGIKKDPKNMPLIPGKGLLAHIQKSPADNAAREAELAKLKAEEEAAKKKALPEGLLDLIGQIEATTQANGLGWPQLKGKAADAYLLLTGQQREASGALEEVEINGVEDFVTLFGELSASFTTPTPAVTAPVQVEVPIAGLLPDDAPHAVASPPAAPAPASSPMADIAAAADKPKAKRTKKVEAAPAPAVEASAAVEAPASPPVEAPPQMPRVQAEIDTRVNVFVDVITEGGEYKDLGAMIDTMADALAKRFNLDDCRLGDAQCAIGFGKWKAALSAMSREVPLPPGNYKVEARGNEIYEEVVQALRQVCRRTGGTWMRGTR